MVKDGYEKIVNIDISDVIIQCMAKKYKHVKQLTCKSLTSLPEISALNASWPHCCQSTGCLMSYRHCIIIDVAKPIVNPSIDAASFSNLLRWDLIVFC